MSGIYSFRLQASDFHSVGRELSRPECIVAERDGTLWVSDNRAALMRIDPDGPAHVCRVGGIRHRAVDGVRHCGVGAPAASNRSARRSSQSSPGIGSRR